jgi:hypothetical protein
LRLEGSITTLLIIIRSIVEPGLNQVLPIVRYLVHNGRRLSQVQTQWNHLRLPKPVPLVTPPGAFIHSVGQQRNPSKPAIPGIADGVLKQPGTEPTSRVVRVNHHVLQPANAASFRHPDGEEQTDQADHLAAQPRHEDHPDRWGFEDQPEAAQLLLSVGPEVGFLLEQDRKQVGLRQVVERGLVDRGHLLVLASSAKNSTL